MNIFALNEDPVLAARALCNKHIVKMLLESTQIMSTVYRLKTGEQWKAKGLNIDSFSTEILPKVYRATHINHPATKWVAASVNNTDWLWRHLLEILKEYQVRYGWDKQHKSWETIRELEQVRWGMWNGHGDWTQHTPFAQCMPDQYRTDDAVTAYRHYYIGEKARFAKWQPRTNPPDWWPHADA